jgi:hypothetical protein
VSGSLTSVFVGGSEQLSGPVALTDASATIDFDPSVLEMSNLFVEAGTVFSLQNSTTPIDLFGGPEYTLGDAPVAVTLNGSPISGLNLAGSTINLTEQGLQIVMTGIATSGSQATVKLDFDFVARATNGATAIPEPGSELLFPAGLLLLGLIFRLQRRDAAC